MDENSYFYVKQKVVLENDVNFIQMDHLEKVLKNLEGFDGVIDMKNKVVNKVDVSENL